MGLTLVLAHKRNRGLLSAILCLFVVFFLGLHLICLPFSSQLILRTHSRINTDDVPVTDTPHRRGSKTEVTSYGIFLILFGNQQVLRLRFAFGIYVSSVDLLFTYWIYVSSFDLDFTMQALVFLLSWNFLITLKMVISPLPLGLVGRESIFNNRNVEYNIIEVINMSHSQPKRVRPSDPNFDEVVLEWFNTESEGDDDPADSDADAICSEYSSDSEVSSLSSQDEDDQDETFGGILTAEAVKD
ncbi:hypothetical protein FQA39_LY14783 [Lamprigera yunnana]|nr:hypothetical protein FQA39_LY14783 [Lamprigera yunnana]